jgi:hypothetical protein
MRRAASFLLSVFILIFALSGCIPVKPVQAQTTEDTAQKGVAIANAYAIAGAVNVYNAVYGDDPGAMITFVGSVDYLKGKLDDLWPENMEDADAEMALQYINIDEKGIATVDVSSIIATTAP